MKRQLRSQLDLVRPNLDQRVHDRQCKQANHHNKYAKERSFQIGGMVFARNYTSGPQWLPGHVTAKRGPVCYDVRLSGGRMWKRHIDQMRRRFVNDEGQASP